MEQVINLNIELKEKTLEQQLEDIKTRIKLREDAIKEFNKYLDKGFTDLTMVVLGRKVKEMCKGHIERLLKEGIDEDFKTYLYELCVSELYGDQFFTSLKKLRN